MAASSEWIAERDAAALAGASVAIGVFDGVHEGHRYLIEAMKAAAERASRRSAIITFDRDPDEVFGVPGFRKLMSDERRIGALEAFHCDRVVVVPFTRALAHRSPREFLDGLFRFGEPAEIHVGEGFRFGYRCEGTPESMRSWGREASVEVFSHPLLMMDDHVVSATEIRALLARGDVAAAARLLGRPYRLEADVVHGRAEGQEMGIRTANLSIADRMLALSDGVYAAYATFDGERYRAAVSVGVAPTFTEARANVEAHLIDFDGDLYGRRIALDFIAWLREMRRFASVDELVETVGANIAWVRDNL